MRPRALALIDQEPRADSPRGAAGVLQRLCRAVTADLDLLGATVTLVPDTTTHSTVAASTPVAEQVEELQFDAGEGPTRDAYDTGRPVIATDLETHLGRWPGFVPAALAVGVGGACSLPLQVGAARLGSLSLYAASSGEQTADDLRTVLVFAEIATEVLIDDTFPDVGTDLATRTDPGAELGTELGDGPSRRMDPDLDVALDIHGHVYQAQGMVMVALGVPLAEALARMRAHAYATDSDLAQVARDVLDQTTSLTQDGP